MNVQRRHLADDAHWNIRGRDRGVELRCEFAAERTFEIDEVDDRRDPGLLLARVLPARPSRAPVPVRDRAA